MTKKITQAVILAGGRGLRLRPLTDQTPKPMVLIHGRPFLEHLIELLKKNGISEVVFLLGYLPEKISKHFDDGSRFGIKINYSVTPVGDENGTRVRKAKVFFKKYFLLLYGDNFWPLNLENLADFYQKQKVPVVVTVYRNDKDYTPYLRKNNIRVDNDGYIGKYDPRGEDPTLNGIDAGFFIIDRDIVNSFPRKNFSLEEFLPNLIKKRQLAGYLTDLPYYSLTNFEKLELTKKFLKTKKAVILDRDGVINSKPDRGDYVKNWSEFSFLPGAIEAIRLLKKNGFLVFVITNQRGIARGLMTKKDLVDIHRKMQFELKKRGTKIDQIYYCPHNYGECSCRKPKPGMLLAAARDYYLDLSQVVLIGDDQSDIKAGKAVGCRTISVESNGNLLKTVQSLF